MGHMAKQESSILKTIKETFMTMLEGDVELIAEIIFNAFMAGKSVATRAGTKLLLNRMKNPTPPSNLNKDIISSTTSIQTTQKSTTNTATNKSNNNTTTSSSGSISNYQQKKRPLEAEKEERHHRSPSSNSSSGTVIKSGWSEDESEPESHRELDSVVFLKHPKSGSKKRKRKRIESNTSLAGGCSSSSAIYSDSCEAIGETSSPAKGKRKRLRNTEELTAAAEEESPPAK